MSIKKAGYLFRFAENSGLKFLKKMVTKKNTITDELRSVIMP